MRTKSCWGDILEIRKLQLVGRASFSVTLPPDWIKEYKLKPSDQITITREDDGSLRLNPGIVHEGKEVKITIDADRCKMLGLLNTLIVGGYLKGCDVIEVVSKGTISETHRKEIRDAVDGLMGLGIIESTSNHVTIQSMLDVSKFPIVPLLKRLCGLASSMYEDALKALSDKDSNLASGTTQRENEIDKIYWLTQRQLAAASLDKNVLKKVGLKGTSDLFLYRTASDRIWSVANNAVDFANNQLALEKNSINDADLQKVARLGKIAQEIFSNSCDAFFKGDVILANKTFESIKRFEETKEELIKKIGPQIKNAEVGMRLMNIIRDIRRITRYGKSIAEVTINNSVAEKGNLP
jgi:phosphate uptake regulator